MDQSVLFINHSRQKMKTIFNTTMLTLALAFGSIAQQEYQFANTAFNPFLLNPAAAGLTDVAQFDVIARTQWLGYDGAPRTFLVSGSSQLNFSPTGGLSEFNVRDEAVMLKEFASKVKGKKFSGMGVVKMKSYAPNKIVYTADCKGNQFAVFSEIYYPEGWKAFVDGKEVEILKTNYLLRGLELTSGKHKIEFMFDLPKYRQSNTLAIIGTGFLFLLIAGVAFMDLKKAKD